MSTKQKIIDLRPCADAREWLAPYGDDLARAWAECPRGDWLLWLAARAGVDRKIVTLAACACARTALRYVPAGEDRPRIAIETTEAWCRGEATIAQVRDVHAAAYAYAADAADADAYAAACAAACAADAHAAYAAAYAADAHAAYAARSEAREDHACIVRSMIAWEQVEQALLAPKEG